MSGNRELVLDDLTIDARIEVAETLPGAFYRSAVWHERVLDRAFRPSWQLLGDSDLVRVPGQATPIVLLEGSLDEPLVVTRDREDRAYCLSNVCTHRANLVCEGATVGPALRCRYHGRRFGLDGRMLSMPEFEGVEDFPSERDDLPRLPLLEWRHLLFTSLAPDPTPPQFIDVLERRVGWLPIEEASFDASRSRDYLVDANWALYCDNYLEGFHIPYVHNGLAGALDYGRYRTELFEGGVVQVGIADGAEPAFELPSDAADHGEAVAAYYYWFFPNLMLNFYPWGLSINVVRPLGVDRTRVSFLSYVWDPGRLDQGAGAGLDRVEREDEAVVESVHRGAGSQLYRRGRYSAKRERGVHHFHRQLVAALAG